MISIREMSLLGTIHFWGIDPFIPRWISPRLDPELEQVPVTIRVKG